jgi:AcrR family transcriptional regulator
VSTAERPLLKLDAIVERAVAVVDEGGADALSLRALARDLGVSAPALYDHIESKDDLLRRVAAVGYAELAASWAAIDTDEPEAWIRASSHAYVDFALERPGRFAVMFRFRPAFVLGPGEVEDAEATALFARALEVVEQLVADRTIGGADPVELALALWAGVHGVASVMGMSPEMGEARWLIDLVIDGLLAGWKERS